MSFLFVQLMMRINECVAGLCDSGPCCRANPPLSRWSPGQGAGRIEIQMAVAPRCSTYRSMSNSQISVLDLRFAPIPVSLEPVLIIEQHPDITTRKHAVSCGLLMMALEPFELRGPSAGRDLRVPRSRRTSRLTADPRQPRRVDTGPAPNAGSAWVIIKLSSRLVHSDRLARALARCGFHNRRAEYRGSARHRN